MYDKEADLLTDVLKWFAPQEPSGIVALPIRDRYAKGYSDLFICVRGRLVVAELKDNIGTASPHQIAFLNKMRKAGAVGGICRSVEEVATLVKEAERSN